MKKLLLAALFIAPQAQAQISVNDFAAHVIGQAGPTNQTAELAKWVQQLQGMEQQFQQLQSTYNAISHLTDINGISSVLGGVSRSYMPSSGSIPGLMSGNGLWSQGQQFLTQDRFFGPSNSDAWQREMQRREQVTSNAKAMAAAAAQDAQQSITNLSAMKARLESAKDTTEVSAVNGYIALEHQRLDANRAQMDNIRLMLDADTRVSQQRDEQLQRQSAEDLTSRTAAISDALQ